MGLPPLPGELFDDEQAFDNSVASTAASSIALTRIAPPPPCTKLLGRMKSHG